MCFSWRITLLNFPQESLCQGARKKAQTDHQASDLEVMWIPLCGVLVVEQGARFLLLHGYWWGKFSYQVYMLCGGLYIGLI